MTDERVYLDYNATAPLREEAREAMTEALALFGNPSSVHAEGRRARAAVERARAQVAALAGCEPGEVVFTGSGTEANNTALRQPAWDRLLVSGVEHDSVLAAPRAAHRQGELNPVLEAGRAGTIGL
jgi:cysteine desulfurase